jgi:hypothetical protein
MGHFCGGDDVTDGLAKQIKVSAFFFFLLGA